ncbi:MAG: primosomal protein N' [Acholeplasmatales bacterium]|nr:primosomal protein N' [Acholeplasmatales bacterium]
MITDKNNKTALMLVPEIALTPQITAILAARFKSDIAILHSRLSIAEKYNAWKKIYDGDIKIVVGARSAIFAPLKNIGIIIIDEEHEKTYVQDNNPKYDALEIARLRGKTHNCPIVLGSATPAITDYHKALSGEYELITLKTRANKKPLPNVEVVSLVDELKSGNKSVFSRKLKDAVLANFKNGDQSILFLNRRGYSSFVMCRSCGDVVKCEHCDISLTYHSNTQILKCHHCGYQINNVLRCKACGSDKIRYVGSGTQKIEEELISFLPEAKIIRLDHDTTRGKNDYEKAYNAFKNKEADILVGTQMITKGLDFENVTLVGILNADLALHYPTYDSTVDAFNLLEQVSGRAGRNKKDGRVIIQTYNPNHYVIKCVKAHDYDSFFNIEIAKRKMTSMPPFSMMYEIMISSPTKMEAYIAAKTIYQTLIKDNKESIVLGPNEHPIFRKNDIYRYVIQVQAMNEDIINKIKGIYPTYQADKEVTLSITRM